MSCPLKKSWKLRWRSARKVAGNAIARVGEAFRACGSEPGELLKAESFKSFFRYFTILDTNRTFFTSLLGCGRCMTRFNRACDSISA
jgi:hypothetical protein